MGLIDEFLIDSLLGGLGPSSNRGVLVLVALFGIGLTCASGWCLARGIDPLHGPEWAFGLLVVAVVGAPIALFSCVIVGARNPEERGVATVAVIANAAAVLTAIAAVVRN
ncbi:MAG TPA: hypothetical protein VGD94_20190 [Vicinamibacterales bacterium]